MTIVFEQVFICNHITTLHIARKGSNYYGISVQRVHGRPELDAVQIFNVGYVTPRLFGKLYHIDFEEEIYIDHPGSLMDATDYIEENL